MQDGNADMIKYFSKRKLYTRRQKLSTDKNIFLEKIVKSFKQLCFDILIFMKLDLTVTIYTNIWFDSL